MRNPTQEEFVFLEKDISDFEKYCASHALMNNDFNQKYYGLRLQIDDIDEAVGASGHANKDNHVIRLRPNVLANDFNRRNILYHEIGHLLFGFSTTRGEKQNALFAKMSSLIHEHPDVLNKNPAQYAMGLKLLEEYIAEKFSVQATHNTLNMPLQTMTNCGHVIAGNYTYSTTFKGGYGMIETPCDKFIQKGFGSFDNVLNKCLTSDFYETLLDKYDGVECMQVLGELGYVYTSMQAWMRNRNLVSPQKTEDALQKLSTLTSNIHLNRNNNEHNLR